MTYQNDFTLSAALLEQLTTVGTGQHGHHGCSCRQTSFGGTAVPAGKLCPKGMSPGLRVVYWPD